MAKDVKQALYDRLPDILKGAQIGQFNLVTGDGVEIVYNKYGECEKGNPEYSPAAKDHIVEYVSRLKPLVKAEYLDGYEELWMRILNLQEVKGQVYNKGKQQDTTFNRNLVAQIIHQIGSRVYLVGVSDLQYAEYLEPGKGKNHSVRQKLGESPDGPIKKAIETLFVKE